MADIGTTLREARMRAHIDITDVESATKIRARFLRALEDEEWEALPGSVYVRSFLRTYADHLGLDGRALVDEYKRRFERPFDTDPRPVARRTRERQRMGRGPRLSPWWLAGVVVVGIVVGLYFWGRSPAPKPSPAAQHPARHVVRAAPRPAPRRTPTTVTLQITPTGPVYVCLVDAAGKTLIAGHIFTPGQSVPAETARTLLLTLGNNAVRLKVNGKPVSVAPSGSAIGLRLTPRGVAQLPPSQQPRCT